MIINRKICPPGLKNNPNKNLKAISYITIHCTGNYAATATALSHANYLYGGSGGGQTSWHYSVDKGAVYQSFEDTQACWHAGDGSGDGNMASIGIEICVNDRAGFPKACDNAAWLAAELLNRHGLYAERVVQHNHWSGKNCPSEIRSGEWGVTWDGFMSTVKKYLTPAEEPVVEPVPDSAVKFDLFGQKTVSIPGSIIDGVTHVQARPLLEAMSYTVGWDDVIKAVTIRIKTAALITTEERDLLQKIVWAEARGEDLKGQILVLNVILNRVKDKGFPDTIHDVIFQENQFQPTRDGSFEKAVPTQLNIEAVERALCVDYSQGALYFRTVTGATPDCWHEKKLTKLFDHGNHRFYV